VTRRIAGEEGVEMGGVLVERLGPVQVVTIDRPQTRNAINGAVSEAIAAAMEDLDGDPSLAVGVITGASGYFSSGMDLKAFAAGERPYVPGRGFAGITLRPPDKPVIAAIEGFALAGGLEVALACDLIVAARGAKLGLPEVKRGITAAAGGLLRLPDLIPRNIAKEIVLTGEPIVAERAAELGLVNLLVEPGEARDAALELAGRIAANAPLALAATKKIVIDSQDWSLEEMFKKQGAIINPVFGSKDAMEGAAAFAEKRPPQWKGR
jgi:enoyl-CoA hydratase